MNRKPPIDVIRELRNEVGFGCPINECGSPYLEWHHFDPPWHVKEHHNPEGMIALCIHHHPRADGGAYTNEQLRAFKKNKISAERVKGQFDWLRNDLLAVVGGVFYYETFKVLNIDGHDVIWFNRDGEGYLRLNVKMLSILARERAIIEDNIWTNIGNPTDINSPPQGKELRIDYENGDHLFVKFMVMQTAEQAFKKYHNQQLVNSNDIKFPITVVEINYKVGGTGIELTPSGTKIQTNSIKGGLISHCGAGIKIITGHVFRQNPSLLPYKPKSRLSPCPCSSGLRFKHCHGLLK
ncbi:SEC-C metal-binding domain-containing protein [Aeromonas caviae]|uniref:YecA family protein n=1 Tax=Aeromonas caviae TaxID=648 RepID=UPI0029DCE845|nr:SEC-C metal-binding domain-containing protein [Aeromonas caviae]MDX7797897.1 SEC-C metal-binding domain-containing protein [Aeromonas caviae]